MTLETLHAKALARIHLNAIYYGTDEEIAQTDSLLFGALDSIPFAEELRKRLACEIRTEIADFHVEALCNWACDQLHHYPNTTQSEYAFGLALGFTRDLSSTRITGRNYHTPETCS